MVSAALLFFAAVASAAEPGVKDSAGMFSADAVKSANEICREIEKKKGWQVVFETLPSLEGRPRQEVALQRARSLGVHGLYILIAKEEHQVQPERSASASRVFDSQVGREVTNVLSRSFKEGKFDKGLINAAKYLEEIAMSRAAAGPVQHAQPRGPDRAAGPVFGQQHGGSSIWTYVLIGGGLLIGLMLLGRLLSGGAAPMAPGGQMGSPMMGGMGGGGGGFFRGLLGGIGGAMLGNWMYDRFSGRGGGYYADQGPTATGGDYTSGGGDDYQSIGGGDWGGGDSGGGGGDFGGSDGGSW